MLHLLVPLALGAEPVVQLPLGPEVQPKMSQKLPIWAECGYLASAEDGVVVGHGNGAAFTWSSVPGLGGYRLNQVATPQGLQVTASIRARFGDTARSVGVSLHCESGKPSGVLTTLIANEPDDYVVIKELKATFHWPHPVGLSYRSRNGDGTYRLDETGDILPRGGFASVTLDDSINTLAGLVLLSDPTHLVLLWSHYGSAVDEAVGEETGVHAGRLAAGTALLLPEAAADDEFASPASSADGPFWAPFSFAAPNARYDEAIPLAGEPDSAILIGPTPDSFTGNRIAVVRLNAAGGLDLVPGGVMQFGPSPYDGIGALDGGAIVDRYYWPSPADLYIGDADAVAFRADDRIWLVKPDQDVLDVGCVLPTGQTGGATLVWVSGMAAVRSSGPELVVSDTHRTETFACVDGVGVRWTSQSVPAAESSVPAAVPSTGVPQP